MNIKDLSSDLRYLISSCGRIFKQLLTALLHNDIMYITHKGRKKSMAYTESSSEYSFCEREKHIEKPSRRLTLSEAFFIGLAAAAYIVCFAFAIISAESQYNSRTRYASFGFIPSEQPDVSAINSADKEELMKINGIGEKRAELIIDFRSAMGGFTDVRQIMYLDGMGEKLFTNILEYFYPGYRLENGSIVKSQ